LNLLFDAVDVLKAKVYAWSPGFEPGCRCARPLPPWIAEIALRVKFILKLVSSRQSRASLEFTKPSRRNDKVKFGIDCLYLLRHPFDLQCQGPNLRRSPPWMVGGSLVC
jgi:hypothetical protein